MRNFSLVLAATIPDFGIGLKGSLPWQIKEDMKFFKQITMETKDKSKQNAVIMGRKTWESIPLQYRPLNQRLNIVLTHNIHSEEAKKIALNENVMVLSSFEKAIECLSWSPYSNTIENIFVIGGKDIYQESLKYKEHIDIIYLTQIFSNENIECDVFFKINFEEYDETIIIPKQKVLNHLSNTNEKKEVEFQTVKLVPKKINIVQNRDETIVNDEKKAEAPKSSEKSDTINKNNSQTHEEYQYLNTIQYILDKGVKRDDRTGVGTLSTFGVSMRYNLRNNEFPLLTTKKVFWTGVVHELLWFIKGSTNAKLLQEKGVHIWDSNASREFLDSRGLHHYNEGDLGPVYGFQWRHWGAEYTDMNQDYNGKGIDQLMEVIQTIKKDPNSRRIVMSAWNPSDINKMALPPCHMFCQFYVSNNELSCQMYQRSADMGLGVPFNIASYALLTCIIAQVCNLECGEFIHVIGDCHVYLNHVEPLKQQLKREPRKFPKLKINPNIKKIDDFTFDDFKILDYDPYPIIKMQMAV